MKIISALTFVSLLLITSTTQAAETQAVQNKPAFSASKSMQVTAQVKSIDHKTRAVTLEVSGGEPVSFIASEEARNLDQVSVGDTVVAEYVESISIQVVAAENAEAGVAELTAMARSKKGEMPGMAAIGSRIEVATVEAINIETNTFKLKLADGSIQEYTARNPENLKKSAVGDVVITTFTQAIALTVEKTSSEK